MPSQSITRREFVKITSATAIAIPSLPSLLFSETNIRFDPKGLPTTILGKTKARVPLIAIGTGSRFCSMENEDEAQELMTYALDHGLYYWDTAHSYGNDKIQSEERLGKILKDRRNEVFLSTKIGSRDPDEAMKQIETSLKRLQTDHLDILNLHSIESMDDAKNILSKDGVFSVVQKMKEEGVAKNIGFTGHSSAEAQAWLATEGDFDFMLIALNHWREGQDFEKNAVPVASKKGMGVSVMKVIRPRETVENIATSDLIKYALTLRDANACIIGTDSMEVLKENINLLKEFKPLSPERMKELRGSLSPFYQDSDLEWMRPNYVDGYWTYG